MADIKYGRKAHSIKKELNEQMLKWANTITDPIVQKAVLKDAIITGGSIASMLMGDPVNDYDVYFKTQKTTILISEYYIKQMCGSLEAASEASIEIKASDDRVELSIRSTGELFNFNAENDKPYRPIYISANAITLSDKVQIVTRFFGSPEEIHKNFDFVHAQCWYEVDKGKLVTPAPALLSMMSRTLQYTGSLYPVCSLFRAKKFIERGWRCSASELLKMAWQISLLNLRSYTVLKEQLTGVDMMYMRQLITALEGIDLTRVDSSYIATIIDRVFLGIDEKVGE